LPANVTALTAGSNMPAGFVVTQKTGSDNFDAQYTNFKLAEETSVETANKIKANNLIYHAGMSMLNDGQKIFMHEPEILTKFIFRNLLDLINPPVAGIKGSVKEAVTFKSISGVVMTAQLDGNVAQTIDVDENGEFGTQLAEGHYTIRISAVGYIEQEMQMDLKLTGLKTLNIGMEKV
jgi:hypothetical protein